LAPWQHDLDAVARIIAAIANGRVEHVIAELSTEAAETAAIAVVLDEFIAAGIAIAVSKPRYYDNGPAKEVSQCRAADAPNGQPITDEQHATCPGHAVFLEATYDYAQCSCTDEEPACGCDENAEMVVSVEVTSLCTDWKANGHLPLYGNIYRPTPAPEADDDLSEAERLIAQAQREAEAAQLKKDNRRNLIARNKAADTAQGVRRNFLRQSLTVKSRQKVMAAWALERVVNRDATFCRWSDHTADPKILAGLLGDNPRASTAAAPPTQHPIILWAHVVTAYESEFARDSHRHKNTERAAYLTHLTAIGYVLSEVEQIILDNSQPKVSAADVDEADEVDQDTDTDE